MRQTSTSDPVPNRSSRGCLTCKQRKKKCDEKKPRCERCLLGGFDCLGYAHLGTANASTSKRGSNNKATQSLETSSPSLTEDISITNSPLDSEVSLHSKDQPSWSAMPPSGPFTLFDNTGFWPQEQYNLVNSAPLYEPKSIPMNPELDPLDLDNMKHLIITQYTRLAHRIAFRPFPYPVESGLANYLIRGSHLICKTLYLGARISQALLDDTNWQRYIGWIDTFHSRILGTHSSLIEVNTNYLADRLAANCNLAVYAFMITNSSIGYTIFRKGAPIFLQLAAKFPEIWQESVYACPVVVLITLARVNASRVSQLMDRNTTSKCIEEYEAVIQNWKPRVDYEDQPSHLIVRLAVQEAWRQAALIYLYMAMCEANSADSRVESLVRQVAQLASTVEVGSPFETHLFIPCLIAGVAARKEKHRSILRKKIQVSQKAEACLLRGADFSSVLDHLWHGVAAGGNPVTWDDYVNSRCLTMPVATEV
ncbi:hypothetical protein OPQ81_010461 [Rhizoctonia solani]|nr:hypothetical protein OPQ81_010461 [Rhizoctonia solani]